MTLYLMLDDEANAEAPAELYSETIETASNGALTIMVRRPSKMADTISLIREINPDGLFLDVALTNALDTDGQPVGFDGIALAQQVRTLQTRARTPTSGNSLPEFPIIRLSKRDVIREYVNEDSTSDDLFDELIDKENVLNAPAPIAAVAAALADDYEKVCIFSSGDPTPATLSALLAWPEDQLARLDTRTLIGLQRPNAPAHVLARFIVVKLLRRAGPMIAEELLAVRLGVDRDKSPQWSDLLGLLEARAYSGAFAQGYPRWWMMGVLDWWQEKVDPDQLPSRLSASDRVAKLKDALGLGELEPIGPNPDSPGDRFWTICIRSQVPVDLNQGYPLLPVYGSESWHDTEYLCLEEALRSPNHPRLSPAERTRVKAELAKRASQ